jgi:hypothetical protein
MVELQISLLKISAMFLWEVKVAIIMNIESVYEAFLHLLDFTDKGDTSFTNPVAEENLMNGHGPREAMGVKEDTPSPIDSDDVIRASMESLSASWSYQRDKVVLQNVTFEVNQVNDTIHDSDLPFA